MWRGSIGASPLLPTTLLITMLTTPPPAAHSPTDATPANASFERTLRPWGWFETLTEVPGYKVKRISVAPGQQISLQQHHQRAEHWVGVVGSGRVTVGERTHDLLPGQHVDIAVGEVHRLSNPGSEVVEIIEVQFGAYLGEDDIVRLQDVYGRA